MTSNQREFMSPIFPRGYPNQTGIDLNLTFQPGQEVVQEVVAEDPRIDTLMQMMRDLQDRINLNSTANQHNLNATAVFPNAFIQRNEQDHFSRRSTIFGMPNSNSNSNVPASPTVVTTNQIISQEHIVKEESKLKLNAKQSVGLRDLMRVHTGYVLDQRYKSDKSKKFAHYMDDSLMKKLMSSEKALGTKLGLNLDLYGMYDLADDVLMSVIARFIRPRSKLEYEEMMVQTFALKPTTESYTQLSILHYDTAMHAPFIELVDEVHQTDDLLRSSATEVELKLMPALNYGKEKSPGVFRIVIKLLGKFGPAFVRAWDETKLSSITSFEQFKNLVYAANNADAQLSRTVYTREAQMSGSSMVEFSAIHNKPSKDASATSANNRDASNGNPVVRSKFPYQSRSTNYRRGNLNIMDHEPFGDAEYLEDVVDGDGHNNAMSEHVSIHAEDEKSYKFDFTHLEQGHFFRIREAAKDALSPEDMKKLPCFKWLNGKGQCENGTSCPYSHETSVMQQFCRERIKFYQNLPWMRSSMQGNNRDSRHSNNRFN